MQGLGEELIFSYLIQLIGGLTLITQARKKYYSSIHIIPFPPFNLNFSALKGHDHETYTRLNHETDTSTPKKLK